MRFNENTAVSSSKILLVPYDRHHVPKYHAWMEDPAIQEATASERLTLEEEYENQESWRASHDKLTFILCQPLRGHVSGGTVEAVARAGEDDAPEKMVGDINFFVYPVDDDDEDEGRENMTRRHACIGEVDIMIADRQKRGKGLGRSAVVTFIHYILRNIEGILREYHDAESGEIASPPSLERLMVKIKKDNVGSIALFKGLGFEQDGDVNYFGEVKLQIDTAKFVERAPEGYAELAWSRPSGTQNPLEVN